MWKLFFRALKISKIIKSTKTGNCFTKMFPKCLCTLTEGIELRLCFVTSLLSLTLLHFCTSGSFVWKVLDLNINFIWLGKLQSSLPAVQWTLFACFSSSYQLAKFHSEVCRHCVFFAYTIWQSLKETKIPQDFVHSCLR